MHAAPSRSIFAPPILSSPDASDASSSTRRSSAASEGTSSGLMLSAGDPTAGAAGYVALEFVTGQVDEAVGSFALQQFGQMIDGTQKLLYEIVPGSGTGELKGMSGTLELEVVDGLHRYDLEYSLHD